MAPLLAFIRDHSPQRHHCYRQVLFDHISSSSLLSIDHHRYHCLCFNVCLSLMLLPLHCLVVVTPLPSRFMSYHYATLSLQTVFQSCFSKIFFTKKQKAGRFGQLSNLNQFFTNKLTIYMFTCPAALKLFCPITCNKK